MSFATGCGDDGTGNLEGSVILDTVPAKVSRETTASFAFHAEGADSADLMCALDGAVPTACTSPTSVDVTEGDHTFAVKIAGSDDPATYDWRVDTTPPDTSITGSPPALDASSSPAFTFEGSPASDVRSFECALDGAAFAACTSPSTITASDGVHTFEVRAVDEAGNADPTPAEVTWTVDATAPTVTITSGPNGPTNTAQPTFAFTVSSDVTVTECQVDAGAFAACTSPTTTATLAQGMHMFTVRVKDAAGNMAQAGRTFTVDTLTPGVTITGGPNGPTNISMPQWTFTTTGSPTTVECRIDGGTYAACSGMFMTGLTDGMHVFDVRVADDAGNTGSDSRTVIVDTVAPTVAITGGPQGSTNITAPTFTFTTTDAPAVIECRMDSASFAPCTTSTTYVSPALVPGAHVFEVRVADDATNSSSATRSFTIVTLGPAVQITSGPAGFTNNAVAMFTFVTSGSPATTKCHFDSAPLVDCSALTFSATLPDGPHTFEVVVADGAGNSANATQTFTVDTVAPTVTITGGPSGTTANTTPQFTFITSGATTMQCRVDAGAPVTCASPFTTGVLGGGPHTFTVDVADSAGNTGTASRSFTVDSTAPSLAITGAPTDPTNLINVSFTFTFGATASTVKCQYDGSPPVDCSTGTFNIPAGAEGSHTFIVSACSGVGVCATDSRTFVVDRTQPIIVATAPADPNNLVSIDFAFAVTGDATQIRCKLDAGVFVPCLTSFVTPPLSEQQHTFVIEATDAAGNVATKSFTWLTDLTAPTVTLTGGPTGLTNLSPLPTFTFTTGGTPLITECAFDSLAFVDCTSGSFAVPAAFANGTTGEGAHTLHVRVTDAATNSFTLDQAFTVDAKAEGVLIAGTPVASDASPDFQLSIAAASTSNPVTFACRVYSGSPAGTFAPCGSVSSATPTSVTFNPGSLTPETSYTLEVQATDPAGNVGSNTFAFQVDNQPPSITNPTLTAQTATSAPGLTFTASDAGTSRTPPGTLTVTCFTDGPPPSPTADGTDCSGGTYGAPLSIQAAGTEGSHTYYIHAHDNAAPTANFAAEIPVVFFVDRKGPNIVLNQLDTSPPAQFTVNQSPTIKFTATDSTAGTITTSCTIDSVDVPCASGAPFNPPAPLARGVDHTLAISAIDPVGNVSSFSDTFRVQGLPPGGVQMCFNGLALVTNTLIMCTENDGVWRYNIAAGTYEEVNFRSNMTAGIPILTTRNLSPLTQNCNSTQCTVEVVTAVPHGLATGAQVRIFGTGVIAYNQALTSVTVTSPTSFTYPQGQAAPLGPSTGGTVQPTAGLVLPTTIVTNKHGRVATSGLSSPQGFVGTFLTDNSTGPTVNIVKAEHTIAPIASVSITANNANGQTATFLLGTPIATASQSGNIATYTLTGPHGFQPGQTVAVEGASDAGYNSAALTVISVDAPNTFTAALPTSGLAAATGGRAGAPMSLQTWQTQTVIGVSDSRYNGTWTICPFAANNGPTCVGTAPPTALSFSAPVFTPTPLLPPATGGTANTITFTTDVPHTLHIPSATFTVQGVSTPGFNGTWRVAGFNGVNATLATVSTQLTAMPLAGGIAAMPSSVLPAGTGGTISWAWNTFRAGGFDTATTWTNQLQFTDNAVADPGTPLELFFQRSGASPNPASLAGGWSPASGNAAVHYGNLVTTLVPWVVQNPRTFTISPTAPFTSTGTVHGMAGVGPVLSTVAAPAASDLYAAVYAKTPTGLEAGVQGGIFWSCDSTFTTAAPVTLGGTWVERDNGISASDTRLVWSVTAAGPPVALTRPCAGSGMTLGGGIQTYFAALRGGGQIYKTTDGGDNWVRKVGTAPDIIPPGAEVYTIVVDPVAFDVLYAGTSVGLYKTVDGGEHWTLEAVPGKKVRNVVIHSHTSLATIAAAPNGAKAVGTTATFTTTAAHGLVAGDSVLVSGVAVTPFNGRWVVTSASGTTFTAEVKLPEILSATQTDSTAPMKATFITSVPHGIPNLTQKTLTISGVGAGYDGTWTVTATNATTLTANLTTSGLPSVILPPVRGTVTIADSGGGSIQKAEPRLFLGIDDNCASLDGVFGVPQPGCTPDPAPTPIVEINP